MPWNTATATYTETQPRWEKVCYVAGLDVAQQHDWSAIAILEIAKNEQGNREIRLKALDRWQMLYPDTLEELGYIFSDEQFAKKVMLATDATGPGLHLYEDIIRDEDLLTCVGKERITPVIITNGQSEERDGRFHKVPKHLLITRLQSAIRRHLIRVPKKLPLYNILESELEGYEMKVREGSKHVSFSNNPRDGGPEHDDTILALALAWWRVNYKPKGTRRVRFFS